MTESIAGYDIVETIQTQAGGSSVRRARRRADGTTVVIKTFATAFPAPEEVARLEHEHTLGKDLHLPGVVGHLDLIRVGTSVHLVLEDFGAVSLETMLAGGPLDLRRFVRIARAAAAALADLHGAGIVHNDICPANILSTLDGTQVKIADLGTSTRLSRTEQQVHHPTRLEGTLAYMSPEQTGRINRAVDRRADLYSLGATFYALLTGGPPFAAVDAMGLIHAHIARSPVPPTAKRKDVPPVLSDLVLTLLAKTPENRYQSALGLLADLDKCLSQMDEAGRIPAFQLRSEDRHLQFSVSEKLYGRDKELAQLLEVFDRASTGGLEVIALLGQPGIGKSVLVHEIHKPIVERRGYFTRGKFDQLAQATPLSAVVRTLRDLTQQLLADSPDKVSRWRERLMASTEGDAAVILDVVPEASHILGLLPPPQDLGPIPNRERFDHILRAYVQAFASAEQPVALFLDDLQWADAASLRFLVGLATDPATRNILLIGAYRNTEVDGNHPLTLALEKISLAKTPVHLIELLPLSATDLTSMVADSLDKKPETVLELSSLLRAKTGGNPFFVTQFLRGLVEDKLLRYDGNSQEWRWDSTAISRLSVLGDVAQFMSDKIGRYPEETRETLAFASFLGATFDLDTLCLITKKSARATATTLWQPMEDGLLIPLDAGFQYFQFMDPDSEETASKTGTVSYKFAHDRIQEASNCFVSPEDVPGTSLRIARLLLQREGGAPTDDRLFDIGGHFKAAHALLLASDTAERIQVADLHLRVAERAKAATAYATALGHVKAGIDLMPADAWNSDYTRMYKLHREQIDCEFLAGNIDAAESAYNEAALHVKGNVDRAELAQLMIRICLTADRIVDGLRIGRESLLELGLELPKDAEAANQAMAVEREKIAAFLEKTPVSELIHHRVMNDLAMEMGLGLLHETWTCGIMAGDFQEIMHTALKIVRLSLEHGNCKFSACGYVAQALVFSMTGDYDNARAYGELSMALCHKFADLFIIPKVHNTFANFTNHWINHIRTNVPIYEESYAACRQSGDRWWGAWAVGWIRTAKLVGGTRLDEVLSTTEKYHPYIEASGYAPLLYMSLLDRQILRCFLGQTASPVSFSTADCDEARIEGAFNEMGFGFGLFLLNNYKSLAAWLFGDTESAAALSRKAEANKDHIPGLMPYSDFFFYNALIMADRAQSAPPDERAECLTAVDRDIEKMTLWASVCPQNFEHKRLLMVAQKARMEGRDAEASSLYERAIDAASRAGYLQNEAIANECAARHHVAQKRERAARGYFSEAAYLYQRWGAVTKVEALREAAPAPSSPGAATLFASPSGAPGRRTESIGHDALDLATAMEAAAAISRELNQDRLLSRLLSLSMRHAGAQKAFFLSEEGGRTQVVCALTMAGPIAVEGKTAVEQRDDLAISVVRYVERTGETVAIDDASKDPRFQRDSYVSRTSAKSILGLPVMRQGARKGVLYLENMATEGAFTEAHIRLLQLLAAQAAISIENAALYDTLEQKVSLRTQELAEKNHELVAKNAEILRAQAQLVHSEKMASLGQLVAGVAHEINNPINFIASGLPSLKRDIDKMAGMIPSAARGADFDKVKTRLARLLVAIEDGTRRTAEIVRNLRSFSRLDEAAQKTADLHESLDSTLALLASKIEDNIKVEKLYGELPLVECFPSQLNQVFMNLLVNALQAMKSGGTLTIRTEPLDGAVRISIQDTGQGIPKEIREKIFDPFFTTKPVGEGTGLGLSITHEIIAKHGGHLHLESEVGVGTTFQITLPLAGAPKKE